MDLLSRVLPPVVADVKVVLRVNCARAGATGRPARLRGTTDEVARRQQADESDSPHHVRDDWTVYGYKLLGCEPGYHPL